MDFQQIVRAAQSLAPAEKEQLIEQLREPQEDVLVLQEDQSWADEAEERRRAAKARHKEDLRKLLRRLQKAKRTRKCYRCGQRGHYVVGCRNPRVERGGSAP